MKGQLPAAEARPLSENVGISDVEKLLHDYVKPRFLKLSAANQQKVMDYIDQISADGD